MLDNMKLGFTFVELLVVGGIIAILFGLTISNLGGLQSKTTTEILINQIKSDIRSQQVVSMNTSAGTSNTSAGVYFYGDRYVLFNGQSFNADNTDNFVVEIPDPWLMTNTFQNNQLIFRPGSGEVEGVSSGEVQLTLYRTDNSESKTLYINRYGVQNED